MSAGAGPSRADRTARVERGLEWLARYEPVIDDPAGFRHALDPPHPVDLHVLPGPDAVERTAARLSARGLPAHGLSWAPRHLRIDPAHPVEGTLPEVAFGFAYRQGAVSALPGEALAPRPGERVLDLCAAPGGKTIYLAKLAGDRARVVAGDPSEKRGGLIVQWLARAGVASAWVVQQDGSTFPVAAPFDAILLDAPCTGEGTFRVAQPRFEPSSDENLARTRRLQGRLLARAWDLLAPGGRLVYSTCSYAPEENEAVVSALLASRADAALAELPGSWPGSPGLTRWEGLDLNPRLSRARRLYPHQTGSWGFFVALLRKDPDAEPVVPVSERRGFAPDPPADDPAARDELARYLGETFGVREQRLEDLLVQGRGRDLWILSRLPAGRADVDGTRLRTVAAGLRAVRRTKAGPRATNALLRTIGDRAERRAVDLSFEELVELLDRGARGAPEGAPSGQHVLRCDGRGAAAGFVRGGQLELELPKAWR
jgi:16S rRNA C967 or C1407 C5-methylase (RsmB/RsmF family)